MTLAYHPFAERELLEAAEFYEQAAMGPGREFVDEFERLSALIAAYPDAGMGDSTDVRILHARRFPYSLIYDARGETIFVLAVAHQRRRPRYWVDRRD